QIAQRGLEAEEKESLENAHKSRAEYLAVLGRAYLHNGKPEPAEKTLQEAYSLDAAQPTAGHALAEVAAKRGDFQEAVRYEAAAYVTNSSASEEARPRTKLEEYYRKAHGSLDGLDDMLDAEYEKTSPPPFTVDSYHPSKARTNRVVLAELFTGAGCPPCSAADLVFDALGERYSRSDLAILVYHQHVPRPDPMANPSSQARYAIYGGRGTPTFAIDGGSNMGGGPREYAQTLFNRVASDVESELDKPADASIALDAKIDRGHVLVSANVDKVKSDSKDLKVQIALVEETLRYSGENGIRFHNMVVRSLGGEKNDGFALKPGLAAKFKQDFDLADLSAQLKKSLDDYEKAGHRGETFTFTEKKYQIDPSDLSVVAFVEDTKDKHILQAAYIRLKTAAGPEGK
ncbi:MAG TPA: hypothetical protein VI756_19960, partial [Blastocatellia bacterium]